MEFMGLYIQARLDGSSVVDAMDAALDAIVDLECAE
jgi:hypothetical protein